MMFYNLWYILFIPVIQYVDSSPSTTVEQTVNKTTIAKGSPKDIYNRTNFTLVSEGGSLSPDKFEILSDLDEELGTKKEKPVARRNGVGLPTLDNSSSTTPHTVVDLSSKSTLKLGGTSNSNATKNSTEIDTNSTINLSIKGNNGSHTINTVAQNSSQVSTKDNMKHINTVKSNVTLVINKTETHKPLVLSYEALSNAYDKNQRTIPAVKSSSNTILNDQIPSPNKERVSNGSNKHPGMIMPVVITILVVPMFAVLGFMALRRGREAWKNRHYKRMDFLLDGMYND